MGIIRNFKENNNLKFRKSALLFGLKFVFGVLLISFVAYTIYDVVSNQSFKQMQVQSKDAWMGIVCFLLMFLNWSLESVKWKVLMLPIKKMSFGYALKSVLAGLATGIVTPNRIGNFLGRIAFVNKEDRIKATLLTLMANLAQFVVTVGFGCIALIFVSNFDEEMPRFLVPLVSVAIFVLGVIVYLKPDRLNRKPFTLFIPKNVEEGVQFISETRLDKKVIIIGLSLLRYFVFVTQYVFLLRLFEPLYSWFTLYSSIMAVYLLVTILPSFFFGKLFMREAAALLILGAIGIPKSVILFTGFLLWLINIAVPSLVGAVFLVGKK